ncbi:YibE/F family protein [Saxibacter everestensis]|uniref:YibE/F family protein n=1 Tax=Saxibacter everestensis TaxID=2909229 RepID=A0ABY8QY56_9MICO|nr:YibE/F family protein [Brevibacteriaceae bacterium ZFBP1038]
MAAGHSHGADLRPATRRDRIRRRKAMLGMLVIIVPIGVATVIGLFALWPSGEPPRVDFNDPTSLAPGVSYSEATVSAVEHRPCTEEEGGGDCVDVDITVAGGQTGSMYVPPEVAASGIDPGDDLKVLSFPDAETQEASNSNFEYIFVDFDRDFPFVALAVAYAVVVVAVARLRGLRALVGLVIAYLVMVKFMLPALVAGEQPVLVALVSSTAIMYVVLYLAHGVSARTTTALLGTLAGIGLTVGLGFWAADAAHLNGIGSEDSYTLASNTDMQLGSLVLCGMIIAGLGVLNDVTITQASAVWELSEGARNRSARELYGSAMRIGRDHIASTVYTVAFAVAGGALPAMVLITMYSRSFLESLTFGELAEELARTLVGSIGLVLAIPITTLIAVVVVRAVSRREPDDERMPDPLPASGG